MLSAISDSLFGDNSPEPESTTGEVSGCNHGHGDPDETFYHEKSVGRGITSKWEIFARDRYYCEGCDSKVTAKRTIGYVSVEEGELVVQDE